MKKVILVMMLFATRGYATTNWFGFPLSQNTNAYTYYDMYTAASNPLEQCYQGAWERVNANGFQAWDLGIAGMGWPTPLIETNSGWGMLIVDAGYTNAIITNGTDVYTNKILVTTYITGTNMFGEQVYTYSDDGGTHIATGFPLVTRFNPDGNEYPAAIYTLWYLLFDDVNWPAYGVGSEALIYFFAQTNYSDGTDFSDYFSTDDGAGHYPASIPRHNFASVLNSRNVGYTTNTTVDGYGVTNVGHGGFLRSRSMEQEIILGEAHFKEDSTWTFIDGSAMDVAVASEASPGIWSGTVDQGFTWPIGVSNPVLRYVTDGVHYPEISVTVQGSTFTRTNIFTILTGQSETQDVDSYIYVLSNLFADVTGINITGSPQSVGDTVTVLYTNTPAFYGVPHFSISTDALDDFQQCIDTLRWSLCGPEPAVSPTPKNGWFHPATNYIAATAQSTNSWEEAIAFAVADVTTNRATPPYPYAYTRGQYDGSTYKATFSVVIGNPVIYSITNAYQHSAQIYLGAGPYVPANKIGDEFAWHSNGTGFEENQVRLSDTFAESALAAHTGAVVGTLTVPEWCREPQSGENIYKGYILTNQQYLLKWDGPNGLQFKE